MLKRRKFLKKTAQALAALTACERMTAEESSGEIPIRTLGRTGLTLPILGYGGAALAKAGLNPLPCEDRVGLVRYAFDRGIRYFDKALALIDSGGFEMCMLSYGYMPRGYNSVWTPRMTKLRDDCLARAHEAGMGIVAMKVIGGGWLGRWSGYLVPGFDKRRLAHLPGAAIRHVLQDKRVDLLAIGMHLQSQIDANLKTLTGDAICTPQDRTLLAEFSARLYETDAIKKMRIE